jgi:2-methylcitrate dehydratase PrpD
MESCEKRYPGTGLNQVPIELMRELIRQEGLTPADIDRIHVDFPIERKNFGGGHGKGPFLKGTAASSVAFQFALLLLDGDLRLERYEQLDNPEILAIVDRCDFDFVHGKPIRYARLKVRTTDGRAFEPEGEEFFFEPEEHRTMVERGAVGILPQPQIDRFLDLLDHLEDVDDASELVRCLTL